MAGKIDNAFYDELGERWFDDETHAIALLRAESAVKLQFVREHLVAQASSILDIGCGAGLIAIPLAEQGFDVTGIDASANSLEVARNHLPAGIPARFVQSNAYHLPYAADTFDVILMMDFLEHVEAPTRAISEAARVLRRGGLLILHTFNRTLASWFIAVQGPKLLSRGCPKHLHVYSLFIKPTELTSMLARNGLRVEVFRGVRPKFSRPLLWSVLHRKVHRGVQFNYTRSLAVGYFANAVKL